MTIQQFECETGRRVKVAKPVETLNNKLERPVFRSRPQVTVLLPSRKVSQKHG